MAPFEAWRRDPVTYSGADHERRVRAVPPPAPRRGRPRRCGGLAAGGRAGRWSRPGSPNLDPALAHPLIVERGRNAAKGGVRYLRDLAWQDVEDDGRPRADAGRRRRAAAAHLERFVERLDELVDTRPRLVAAGRGALLAGPPRARGPPRRRAPAPRARPARVRPPRRGDAGPRRGRDRQPGLRRGPARERRGPPDDRAGDARRLHRVDRAGAAVPRGHRPRDVPRRRDVRGRAVAGVPAAGARRGVVHRAAGVQRLAPRPLLRPVRARRRRRGGDPGAAVEQQLRVDPHDLGPRGVPRPPLAPGAAQDGAVVAGAQGLRDAVLQRGLGAVRRARHARAGLLRRTRSTSSSTCPRRSSGPRGSSSTRRSTWARWTSTRRSRSCATRPPCPRRSRSPRSAATAGGRPRRRRTSPGCLEILEIRRRYLDARGFAGVAPADVPVDVLRDFHDTIAAAGSLPLGLADRAVMASLA